MGVVKTIEILDVLGVQHVGISLDSAIVDGPVIFNIDGYKIGYLAYSRPFKAFLNYKIRPNILSKETEDSFISMIGQLKKRVDLIVVSLHWGIEYSVEPTLGQRFLAKKLANAGVDIIVGHHPHVLLLPEFIQNHSMPLGGEIVLYSLCCCVW